MRADPCEPRCRWDGGGTAMAMRIVVRMMLVVGMQRCRGSESGSAQWVCEQIGAVEDLLQAHSTLIANPRINTGAQSQATSIYLT